MKTPAESRICLYNTAELNAVMDSMARQMMGLITGDKPVAVVGVLRRGAPLADMLTERMVRLQGLQPPLRLDLKVKRYADDLRLLHPDTLLAEQAQHAELDLTDHTVLLVDDVLYTGHSVLKVLTYLLQKKPTNIKMVCLTDRCTTRLPVQVDVVGVRLAEAPADIVECHVPPYEAEFKIELVKPPRLN